MNRNVKGDLLQQEGWRVTNSRHFFSFKIDDFEETSSVSRGATTTVLTPFLASFLSLKADFWNQHFVLFASFQLLNAVTDFGKN
jgi:hypothetical protein